MEMKKKRIDLIRNIDRKKNIITKNTKLIDNLFLNKLYRNYLLSQRKKRNLNIFELISEKPEKKKLIEKMIIDKVMNNIPPNLRQYFSDFEYKKFANQLILSNSKKKNKNNKSISFPKNKLKINSRNKSSSYRLNKYNLNSETNTFNDEDKINLLSKERDNNNNLSEKKKINQKHQFILNSARKKSSNILRYNITLNDNNTIKEIYENKYNKLYNTMSSKNNTFTSSIFNLNNSVNNLTEEDSSKDQKSSHNLSKAILNIETKNSNNIYNYNFMKKVNNSKKFFLNSQNSKEKIEKKYDSRELMDTNTKFNKRNLFNLPKKKFKTELLNSFSPEEIFIIENASNISNHLNEIKKGIKSEKKDTPKNIKYMILKIKKEKNKEINYIKKEVNKNKYYEYFMNNKKQMERKTNIFKILKNSFNSERNRRNINEYSFIKTLNNICDEEKHYDSVVKQVYKQNYWLRLNKNKKNAIDIKNRIAKINAKGILVNTLINKINKFNNIFSDINNG